MRILSSLIFLLVLCNITFAQSSPHGNSLTQDCSECHESTTWKISGAVKYNHDQTGFSLRGQHKSLTCQSCHNGLVFTKMKTDCFSCHKDIHQNSVGFDCQKCHTTDSWIVKDIQNIHRMSRFPLAGPHQAADCIDCHKQYTNLNFQPMGIDCYSCHSSNYMAAKNPDHVKAGFSRECLDCHSVNEKQWAARNFAHEFFPLVGMHKADNCFACHKSGNNFGGLSKECFACHESDFTKVTDPNHVTGNFSHDCTLCHTTMQPFSFSNFDHSKTRFQLAGVHSNRTCISCHQMGYKDTPLECAGCHQANYNNTTNPNHTALLISTACQTCHNTTAPGWRPALFPVHNNYYQLLGAHAAISNNCTTCHNNNYTNTPSTCYGCHITNYNNTTNPKHSTAGFGTDCESCHSQTAWKPANFNHDQNYFPIYSGKHNGKWNLCSDCHTNITNYQVFTCTDCHEHNKPDTDNKHRSVNGYVYASAQCLSCHPRGTGDGFNHGTSQFPLTGAHLNATCQQCHQTGYANTPTQCDNCHHNKYTAAVNPNHQNAGIPLTCNTCHNTTDWTPSTFNHTTTGFTLAGAHVSVQCSSCHQGTVTGLNNQCVSCHQSNYNSAPNHTLQQYPTDCTMCHAQNAWTPSSFNHSTTTFPLTGAHVNITCSQCHQSGFTGTPTACLSCHQSNFNNAPNHLSQQYPTNCILCHTTTAWTPSSFNHQTTTFPLTGAHISLTCSQCHQSGFTGTPTACLSCHQSNYNNAPNHLSQQYPTNCIVCHTTTAWIPSSFNHQLTQFPLTGAHISVNCSNCHQTGYTGTPTACVSCHQTNYNNTTNPSHSALVLSTDCQTCHTTNPLWKPATFPVHNNYYQLLGAHAAIANNCATCHNGNYNTTPNTCYACHQNNYNTATPNHVAPGFSHECTICHTQNAWTPSTFQHDPWFPIYSGKHRNKWTTCAQCHPNSSDYTQFTCTTSCHPQNQMNNEHNGVSGYQYLSSACYNCHPTGSELIFHKQEIRISK